MKKTPLHEGPGRLQTRPGIDCTRMREIFNYARDEVSARDLRSGETIRRVHVEIRSVGVSRMRKQSASARGAVCANAHAA